MLGKARSGGKKTGKNLTDRGKKGTKKSLVTDGDGGPLGVVIAGANTVEQKLLKATIEAIVVERPDPDEGGAAPVPGRQVRQPERGGEAGRVGRNTWGTSARPAPAGVRRSGRAAGRARRWVVERTFGWLSKCRGMQVRYEKKGTNYLELIQIACRRNAGIAASTGSAGPTQPEKSHENYSRSRIVS